MNPAVFGSDIFFNHRLYAAGVFTLPPPEGSSPSFQSSPYILNFKGRTPVHSSSSAAGGGQQEFVEKESEQETQKEGKGEKDANIRTPQAQGKEVENRGALNPKEDTKHGPSISTQTDASSSTGAEDFFDAAELPFEETSSEGSFYSPRGNILIDQLLEETSRRKKAEAALADAELHLEELIRSFSSLGITSLTQRNEHEGVAESEKFKLDSVEQFSQRLAVARMVSTAIASGVAKAEKQEELESKNREIARLRDKLHYFELVNREMCQRNQETLEIAKRRRHRQRSRRHWAFGIFAASLCIGTPGYLAYKYLPWENFIRQNSETA